MLGASAVAITQKVTYSAGATNLNKLTRLRLAPALSTEFFAQMEALKSKYSNLQTHEVSQIFCNTECIVSDDAKHPYYFDDDHLNLTGAKLLKPVFEKVM